MEISEFSFLRYCISYAFLISSWKTIVFSISQNENNMDHSQVVLYCSDIFDGFCFLSLFFHYVNIYCIYACSKSWASSKKQNKVPALMKFMLWIHFNPWAYLLCLCFYSSSERSSCVHLHMCVCLKCLPLFPKSGINSKYVSELGLIN